MLALLNRQSLLTASRATTSLSRSSRAIPIKSLSPITTSNTLLSHRAFLIPTAARYAANPQAGKPASDNLSHMVKNVKEEAGSVATSIGKSVAGIDGNKSKTSEEHQQTSEIMSDAKTIVNEMAKSVPRPALLWGAAGVVPYISTAGASIYLARQAQLVSMGLDSHIDFESASALLLHAENIQIQFGAILLSFLGAIHWGFEFSKYGGEVGNRRYIMGLIPFAMAWPTLLFTPQLALVSQWAAFVVTWFIDLKATTNGWVPQWYSSYRFGLSAAVGLSIIATLAGTNYYDSDQSRSSRYGSGRKLAQQNAEDAENRLDLMRANAEGNKGTFVEEKTVGGDVEAKQAGDDGDSFVQLGNPKRREEERKKKEEEEKKKKEEEAQKKKEEESKKKDEGGEDKEDKEDKGDGDKEE